MYDEKPAAMKTRFLLVQKMCDQFWNVWTKLYFPTLLWQPRWHQKLRNLKVGDICLLQDPNAIRGEWRLCIVTEVFPDSNGIVRNVEVKVAPRYKGRGQYQSQVLYQLKRHVSNLIVIVPVEETNKDKEVTSHESQDTSQEEVTSQESQVTSQKTGGGVTKMRSQ